MSLNTQIGTSLIKNGSIVNEDISGSAAIDMSKINGLETALNGKEPILPSQAVASDKVLVSNNNIKSWKSLIAGILPTVPSNSSYTLAVDDTSGNKTVFWSKVFSAAQSAKDKAYFLGESARAELGLISSTANQEQYVKVIDGIIQIATKYNGSHIASILCTNVGNNQANSYIEITAGLKYATGAGAGKVLTSDASGKASWQTISSAGETVVTSVSSLTNIDCSSGTYFVINISASATISLTNVTAAKYYVFAIKNTGASSITVTLPTGALASNPSFTIAAGLTREFSMINANSVNRFQVSGELNTI